MTIRAQPRVGAFVLETLTTGMYSDPRDALRELVQNAADSIWKARREGVLPPNEGRVVITIDEDARTLSVRDNGLGIPSARVPERLLGVGVSVKDVRDDAGFRGIGRLAAAAYCESLTFETTFQGEALASVLTMDCRLLRDACSPFVQSHDSLEQVLSQSSTLEELSGPSQDHWFEVRLSGINEDSDCLLAFDAVNDYMSQVAPLGYDAHHFIHATTIEDWARHHGVSIPTVELLIKTSEVERQVFKPYKTHYKTRAQGAGRGLDVHVRSVAFYPEQPTPEDGFWMWYGKSDLVGQLGDEKSAGLRLRKVNIALDGNSLTNELFRQTSESNSRFNLYFIGEIHILSNSAIPNARRDGLEDRGDWPSIRGRIVDQLRVLSSEVRAQSQARNLPTIKLVSQIGPTIARATEYLEAGVHTEHEAADVEREVRRAQAKVKKALVNGQRHGASTIAELDEVLAGIAGRLTANTLQRRRLFRSDLDRKQRHLLQDILELLSQALEPDAYRAARTAIMSEYGEQANNNG